MSFDDYFEESKQRTQDKFIRERRVASLVNEKFEGTGLRDDVDVTAETSRVTVEPNRFLDDEFDLYRETVNEFAEYQPGPSGGTNVVHTDRVEDELPPDPRDVHEQRSAHAQTMDERMDAPLTNDPEKYASDPSHYDFPGVDTPPTSDVEDISTISRLRDLF